MQSFQNLGYESSQVFAQLILREVVVCIRELVCIQTGYSQVRFRIRAGSLSGISKELYTESVPCLDVDTHLNNKIQYAV